MHSGFRCLSFPVIQFEALNFGMVVCVFLFPPHSSSLCICGRESEMFINLELDAEYHDFECGRLPSVFWTH